MSFPKDDNELDRALAEAFPPPAADFEAWQRQHAKAVACLDPQRTSDLIKRRRLMKRTILFTAAAACWSASGLALNLPRDGPGTDAFAQTLEQIQKAKTITWKTTFYEHITSKDGKRTWLIWSHGMCLQSAGPVP